MPASPENGGIEGPHGHLKRAIEDALLLRGRAILTTGRLSPLRGRDRRRRNARNAKRIDAERAQLRELPDRRTTDYEELSVRVASSGGFRPGKVLYTVPSRLIGHRLRLRLDRRPARCLRRRHDLATLPRGRASSSGKHDQVVNYRHVIHSLRRKPMALLNPLYRDRLFPRSYRL